MRRRSRPRKLRSSATQTTQECSMSLAVRPAEDPQNYQLSTSCASTATISGLLIFSSTDATFFDEFCRCLGGQETECPTCTRQHGVIREIRRNNERLADQHELFLADVEESGFNAVASAFSRGLMGPPRLDEVATR